MKRKVYYTTAVLLLGLACGSAQAQASLNASGGNATGTGGSASYSVGQLAYTVASGNGGSSSAGVQQAFEIFTSSHEVLQGIRLITKAFPNPVEGTLTLHINRLMGPNLRFEMFDMQGKSLSAGSVSGEITAIPMATFPVGTYTLRVMEGQNEIKSFKILKNQ
jgi:Secretion system C-terminal sorting domain